MVKLGDRDGNLIERSMRGGREIIVTVQVMEYEQATWNSNRILDKSTTEQIIQSRSNKAAGQTSREL